MQSIGFKEWAMVCEALGSGEQTIIVRKGGIAEGRQGFSFQHQQFFLFPTWFHEQPEKVRSAGINLHASAGDEIEIRYFAELELTRVVDSLAVAEALEPLHILKPEVVRERFAYDDAPGVHVALVRVYRLAEAWKFPNEKRFGGCRSWVTLPDHPADLKLEAVLSGEEHERKRLEFLRIVGDEAANALNTPLR